MMAAVRSLRARWLELAGTGIAASISLGLLVLLTAGVAVAGARASVLVPTRALQHGLAKLPASQKSVLGSVSYDSLASIGTADARLLTTFGSTLRTSLTAERLPLAAPATDWSGLTSGYNTVTGGARHGYDGPTPPVLELAYRDSLRHYASRVTGRLPDATTTARSGPAMQIAVTAATARRFGLTVGSRMRIPPNVTLVVTGIITPRQPDSAFWTIDQTAGAPTLAKPTNGVPFWQGGAFVGPREIQQLTASTDVSAIQASWGFPLDLNVISAGQAVQLHGVLGTGLASQGVLSTEPPVQVALSCGAAAYLGTFGQELDAVAGVLDLLLASLAAIGIVVVLLGTLLLADQRRAEFIVLRARGASRRQLAALALRAAALTAVPAGVVGAVPATLLTPGPAGPLGWWLAALTVVAALAGLPVVIAGGQPRTRRAGREPDRRTRRRRAAARRLVTELTLIAVAAGGLVLAQNQAPSGQNPDLFTSTAPVLAAIPAAIIALRVFPMLARWLLRVAGLRRGVIAYVGLARAARTSTTSILPAFALVLVLAVASFGGMVRGAITRGEVTASWQQTGADATVDALDASLPLSPAAQRALAAVPGVQRTAAITMTTGVVADGTELVIVLVRPRQYAALIAATPTGPRFPAGKLAPLAGTGHGSAAVVPAVATPAAATALGGLDGTLAVGNIAQPVRIHITTMATAGPAIAAQAGGPLLVLPWWGVRGALHDPNLLLVTGAGLSGPRLDAVAARLLPGSRVELRSAALAVLARAPLPHAIYVAYLAGTLLAGAFGILVLLISLLLTAGSRARTLARLAAMGLSASQASWLVLTEALPEIVVAMACGTGCAWALGALVGPDLNLAAFTGSGAGVQVRAEPAALALTAAALLIVALLTLTGQAIVAGRRGVARALRIGE